MRVEVLYFDGRDVDATAAQRRDYGLKCRLYAADEGLGAIPDELIAAALAPGHGHRETDGWRRA